jgi:hypothetical protein
MKRERRYLSYLLRLWQEDSGVPEQWRASLESPRDGERLGFASLDELFAFLRKQAGRTPPSSRAPADQVNGG